jgi:hypothetical protein
VKGIRHGSNPKELLFPIGPPTSTTFIELATRQHIIRLSAKTRRAGHPSKWGLRHTVKKGSPLGHRLPELRTTV